MPALSDNFITFSVLALVIFSLFMVTSASMGHQTGDPLALVIVIVKQMIFAILGYLTLVFSSRYFNFDIFNKNIYLFYYIIFVMLLMPLAFTPIGGTYGWIYLPIPFVQITIQPAEFAKIFSIILISVLAFRLEKQSGKALNLIKNISYRLLFYVIVIIFFQRDLGSGLVLIAINMISFLLINDSRLRKYQYYIFLTIVFGIVMVLFTFTPIATSIFKSLASKSYQFARFMSAADPFIERYGSGFQLVTGLISFASGGINGLGYSNSIRKYAQFPAADTDFILAIIVEEVGFIGYAFILIAYVIIIYRLFHYAMKIYDTKYRIILVGTALYLAIHFILNVGGVSALIPLTGVPLLMVSSGGSSVLALMFAIGMCQNIIIHIKRGIIS